MTKKLLFVVTSDDCRGIRPYGGGHQRQVGSRATGQEWRPARQTTFDLKADGATLTGTMTRGMVVARRGGVAAVPGRLQSPTGRWTETKSLSR